MRRPAPRGLAVPESASAAVRALPPIDVPPGDLRAAFDLVREHPVVLAARDAAPTPAEREAVVVAVGALVARSVRASRVRSERTRLPF